MTPMPITKRIPSTGELIRFTDGSMQLQCIAVALLTNTISKSTFEIIRFRLVGVVEPKRFVYFGSSELASFGDYSGGITLYARFRKIPCLPRMYLAAKNKGIPMRKGPNIVIK